MNIFRALRSGHRPTARVNLRAQSTEEAALPRLAVQELASAIPAFIGYTERTAGATGHSLTHKPTKVTSWAEYEQLFGGPATPTILAAAELEPGSSTVNAQIAPPSVDFLLAHAVQHYFGNGGGPCWVVSVGGYESGTVELGDAQRGLRAGLEAARLEPDITLTVVPEAVRLDDKAYTSLVQAMLQQCADAPGRFAILDLREGDQAKTAARLASDRALLGGSNLMHGAVYYPWLRTTLRHRLANDERNVKVSVGGAAAVPLGSLREGQRAIYNAVKSALAAQTVVLPPSAAIAGVYARTDRERGVWRMPAGTDMHDVIEPVVPLTDALQQPLKLDADGGKSINAIRSFPGKGNVVWGARSLAGNDNEWSHLNVRRFVNTVARSAKTSTQWATAQAQDANTWRQVREMLESYLQLKWRQGAMPGATPAQAYYVRCGLRETMTAQDVTAGRLNIEIGLAVLRPSEFIVLKITHQTQVS